MLTAEICVNVTAKKKLEIYTYAVPQKFNFLAQGWRVIVPFGRQIVDGFVMEVKDTDQKFDFELKEIKDVVDEEIWFTPQMLKMASLIADFYLCPLSQAMSLFMAGNHSKKIAPKTEFIIKPAENFSEIKITAAQKVFLDNLRECGEIPLKEVQKNSYIIKKLLEKNLIVKESRRILRDSYANVESVKKEIELTAEQKNAVNTVSLYIKAKIHAGFLLHGVTGSGKTQVYIELTKIVRQIGRRALILVPEISLTGQIVKNFKAHFSDVLVIHSKLSIEERNDIFYKIRKGEVAIVIGARSAIFTPLDDVGLIVIDEEQDSSYKQDAPPFYHAKIIAEEFAKIQKAAIIFGSATPSFETYYRAQNGGLGYLEMPRRISNNPLPEVELVDMRTELQSGNRSVLSFALKNLLEETLKNHQQAILLLNARGYSTFVMCRDCGETVRCPECGISMHYHITDKTLKCHHCEIEMTPPAVCPKCGSKRIKYFGTGTQKLEEYLSAELPAAKILRMDRDTTTKKFAHDEILNSFKRGEADILFGTKMVAKGHDIPNVTAVGILSADSVLNFPDFRAAEQCFDLITQAAGRAGRGDFPGKVIVQTYNTDADAVKFAVAQDFKSFYNVEIVKREFLFFPPFSRLVKLIFTAKKKEKAVDAAERIVNSFKLEVMQNSEVRHEILGPIPAVIENLRGEFQFVVLIKTSDLEIVRGFLRFHNLHIAPNVQIDFDPLVTN
ncbi:MAG: primosomal protein N' [Selenomonadaceae bacterium]|nr:primosomal protein N' [Selenomonadaceae bacterium]